ncbi:MAG: DNA polymerase III subunit beta [Chloroflexota bacterium]
MKVSVLQENLAFGLGIVSRATSLRSSLPVLENVLVASDGGRLRLSATNLELGITCWIGANIEAEGSTTVPARTFTELVKTMSDRIELSLTAKTETLKVSDAVAKGKVKGISANDFPPARISEGSAIEIAAADLKEAIQQVAFAASSDLGRPVLNGVLIGLDDNNTLTLVAVDGFRLSKCTLVPGNTPKDVKPFRVIVPVRSLSELARILRGDETVSMSMLAANNLVVFRTPDIEATSLLIDGEFPDYQQIIPCAHNTQATVNTSDLLTACKQANIFARDGDYSAMVNIFPTDDDGTDRIVISGKSAETGGTNSVVDAVVNGGAVTTAFNVRFLQDALKAVKTPSVVLETMSAQGACVIRPVDNDTFLQMVMPMKTKE